MPHGFENVDSEPDARFWIATLDRLRTEPFYRDLKTSILEHLNVREGGRYLEVGCGTGADSIAARDRGPCCVVGTDGSHAMVQEARRRGLYTALVAAAESLPLADGAFEGCWAERVSQHLAAPDAALQEMMRVLKPGGMIIVTDPDYGTHTTSFPDINLADRVLRFHSEVGLRNGTQAHRMAQMFRDAGLTDVAVEQRTLNVTDPEACDNVLGLRSWARSAMQHGWFANEEVERWERMFDAWAASDHFQWTVDFFITSGRKPER